MTPPQGADARFGIEAPVRAAAERLAATDAEAALAILEPLIASCDASLPARFLLAMTAWKMARLDWSIALMRACHERWPMDGTVAESLASLYAQSGNLVESLYVAKLATALGGHNALVELVPAGFPSFERAFIAIKEQPLLQRAKLSLADGRLDDAVEMARQHVALGGNDRDGSSFHAAVLLRAGRAADAVAALRPLEDDLRLSAPLASLYAKGLAAIGECEAARRWHGAACRLAPGDAAIAAARVADAPWLDGDAAVRARGADWAGRFAPPPKPRQWRRPEGRLVVAYLVAALGDPRDAAAVAAIARAHDRSRVKVLGYGNGAQSWPENALLSGAFDIWQDIGALDAATLARFFMHDRVDVVVDASGFGAPQCLLALARLRTALRVSWLGNAPACGAPLYDARIVAAPEGASEADWWIAGAYPLRHPLKQMARSDHPVQFGTDVCLAQLDDATVAAWDAILRAMPEAKLLLRAGDTGPARIERLVARFGRELAARIDLFTADRFEEFYPHVDVALAPRRGVSARMAAEALGCCVPTVAFAGTGPAEPYAAFLRAHGLGAALVAADDREYASLALAGTHRPAPLTAAVATAASRAIDDAARFAAALEERALRMLAACAS